MRWVRSSMLVLGQLLAAACAAGPRPTVDSSAAAEARLRALVEARAEGKRVTTRRAPGALDTTVVIASTEGAYPGTGVSSVVLDGSGATFGAHGERPLGALADARGWFARLPDEAELLRLVNDAQFDGLMMIDTDQPHTARVVGDAIELRFVRRAFPSLALDAVVVKIPRHGPPAVEIAAVPVPEEPPPPSDPVEALEVSLAARQFTKSLEAIARLKGHREARALLALARAVALGNAVVAGDAVTLLGATPEAATALKAAFQGLEVEVREKKIAFVAEFHGASFAAQLR
jgi:hypothetical protein